MPSPTSRAACSSSSDANGRCRERERRILMPEAAGLPECYADVFATIFAFRAARNEERPSYRALRSRVMSLLADAKRCVDQTGRDPNGDAQYAVVALVDETVTNSDWEHA